MVNIEFKNFSSSYFKGNLTYDDPRTGVSLDKVAIIDEGSPTNLQIQTSVLGFLVVPI